MRLKKLALNNLGNDNQEIYNNCREKLSEIESIVDNINYSQGEKKLIQSVNTVKNTFIFIRDNIEVAKSYGQDNEDALREGNSEIENLESQIEAIQEQIDTLSLEAGLNNRLKKIATRFICDIHDDIMKYCNVSLEECDRAIEGFEDESTDEEDYVYIIEEFIDDMRIEIEWINGLINDAELANEKMSNGIIEKENKIFDLNEELEQLTRELEELQKY